MDEETESGLNLGRRLAARRQVIYAAGRPSMATELTRTAFDFALEAGELSTVRAAVIRGAARRWPGYAIDAKPEVIADRLRRLSPAYEPLFLVPSRSGLAGWIVRPDIDELDQQALAWLLGLWLDMHPHDHHLLRLAFSEADAAEIVSEASSEAAAIPGPEYRSYFGRSASLGFLLPYSEPECSHFSAAVHPRAVANQIGLQLLKEAVALEAAQIVVLGSNDERSQTLIQSIRKGAVRNLSRRRLREAIILAGRGRDLSWADIGDDLLALDLIQPSGVADRENNRQRARTLWKAIPDLPPEPSPPDE